MTVPVPATLRYRFGPFELDPTEGKLLRDGQRVKLQELPFQLLLMLVENPGTIINREELRQRLWSQNTFLEFDNSLGVAVRKVRDALRDEAETPVYLETIPRRGYRFLVPVEKLTAPFFPSPIESEKSVPGSVIQPAEVATAVTSRRFPTALAGLAFVVLVAATLAYRHFHKAPPPSPIAQPSAATSSPRRSLAVLGFRNLPGHPDDDWMSHAFTEMLGTELAAGGILRIVSDEDVSRAKREISLGNEDSLSSPTLTRLRQNPGADVVVLGTYTPIAAKSGKRIRLDIRVQDTSTGDTIAEDAVSGTDEELFEMISRAGADLRTSLGVYPLGPAAASMLRASLPANSAAVRHYSQGNDKLWAFDFGGARAEYVKALAADPKYPLAHSALSEAYWHLGRSSDAVAEAKLALDLSKQLPEEDQLLIAGQYARTLVDYPNEVKAYTALFALHPDNLHHGLLLATAQMQADARVALRTLDTLRKLPAPAGDDPRIDLLEATAQIGLNLEAGQAAAKRAVAKGTAMGSPLVVGRAYGVLCQQGSSFGVAIDEVSRDCENAIRADVQAGDRNGEARNLNDYAVIAYIRGDFGQAEKMYRAAAKQFHELDEHEGAAATANNLGEILLLEGHLDASRKMLESAIPDYEAIQDSSGVALILCDVGRVLHEQGNLQAAATKFQQAKELAASRNDDSTLAVVLSAEGDLQLDRNDIAAARQSYAQALKLRMQIGETQNIAESQLSLASLSVGEGHAAEVESAIRKCREQFHKEQQIVDEIAATTTLAEALLAQNKLPEARAELQQIAPQATKSENLRVNVEFQLTSARLSLRSNQPDQAQASVQKISAKTHSSGIVPLEYATILFLAEVLQHTDHAAQAQQQLLALQKAAHDKGFERMATKAADLRRPTPAKS